MLGGVQICTAFCDGSETMTVGVLLVRGRGDESALAAAAKLPPGGDMCGVAHAATATHAIANKAGRSNRAGIGRNEL